MNKNYLKYNNLGILVDSQLEQVSQGNHNVDYYYIAYDVYDYTNGYVTVSVTLPDGTKLPELATSPKEFEFESNTYKGFVFVLRDTLTAEAGTLSMTFNLKSAENDTQLCSSRLNVTIHESDMHTSPTITDAQYEQMQEVIRENTVKVDEALQKANDALYHDATIVKVNGEVQQTWDATYAQKITEESLNLFDISKTYVTSNSANNATVNIAGGKISYNTTYSNNVSGQATIRFYIDNDMLENGKTYNVSSVSKYTLPTGATGTADIRLARSYISTNSWGGQDKKQTIDKSTYYYYFVLYLNFGAQTTIAGTYTGEVSNIMLCEGEEPLPYEPYNSSSHITNPQADLLKSEWEKGVNLLDTNTRIENQSSEVTCSVASDGSITLNGSPTSTAFINIYCDANLELGDYVLHNFNSVVNANVLTRIFYNNSSSNALSYTETNCSSTNANKNISITNESYTKGVGLTIRIASGTTLNNFVIKPMLTKGTTLYGTFYQYNGSIIHEKDIEPVLLWKNGTPNVDYPQTTLNVGKYKRLDIICNRGTGAKSYIVGTIYPVGENIQIIGVQDGKVRMRQFNYNAYGELTILTGVINDTYGNSTTTDSSMIPLKIYGFNY